MFDFVHEKKRLVQIVLAIIILPFAFWGVDSYRKSTASSSLASVNGEKIGQQEFDDAMRQQQQRMKEIAGNNFDPSFFEQPEVKRSIMESLISQHLLTQEAARSGFGVSDDQTRQLIAGIEAFQTDGKFDKKKYEAVLGRQNMTSTVFEYRVRNELSSRQLSDAYVQNGFSSNYVADTLIRLNEQQRVVSVAKLNADTFLKQVNVQDTAVNDYYQHNPNEFKSPEQAKVEYVILSVESILPQISLSETDIKNYYEEHQSELGTQEQRQASHILIAIAKNTTEAEKQAAKAKAEDILHQIKATPDKFAALAKQYSQDSGSASKGGDLGMFGKGAMVKPFEDAAFKLKAGEVSDLVQSDFGYHIIKLTSIKPAKVQPLAEVHELISQRLKAQQATERFAELADKFTNAVYEQSDSLKPAAELVHAPIKQGGWLEKGKVPTAPWTEKAIQAVFSDEAIKNKRNTTAIEVGQNTLLAARVLEYKAASVRPLAEVNSAIRQKLQRQQVLELVNKEGTALLGKLQHGDKVSVTWQAAQSISRAQHTGVDNELARQIFQVNGKDLPAYIGSMDAQNGYVLARVDAIKDMVAVDADKHNRYVQQIRQMTGEELLRTYLQDVKSRAKIDMMKFAEDDKK
jgi:peptidyl-prolyl cis-trans isomerase D